MSPPNEITELLVDWSNGDAKALDRLFPLVEHELHHLAHGFMRRENPDHTLQTTALINETYLKLINQNQVQWQGRAHFYAIAAKIMRRVLMNYARDRKRAKRGGGAMQVSLSEAAPVFAGKERDLIALNDALQRFAEAEPRKAEVVEMRFFGGLSVEEMAAVLNVSAITVMRDWRFAKAWLIREMKGED